MDKYRKKPVVVSAIKFNWTCRMLKALEKEGMLIASCTRHEGRNEVSGLSIKTLEGSHKVSQGDYIIKGIAGEFYPCKPAIFEATYEEACDEQ